VVADWYFVAVPIQKFSAAAAALDEMRREELREVGFLLR